jgi:hypothetical protein
VAPWRSRAVVVLLLAVLHVGSGVVSALGACCASEAAHGGSPRLMDCCLKGGPNHICPYMSKSRRSKAPGKIDVYCPMGHDAGAPVTGFMAMPEPEVTLNHLLPAAAAAVESDERAAFRTLYPPTPPPKVLL